MPLEGPTEMNRGEFIRLLTGSLVILSACQKQEDEENSPGILFPKAGDFFIGGCVNPVTINEQSNFSVQLFDSNSTSLIARAEGTGTAQLIIPEVTADTPVEVFINGKKKMSGLIKKITGIKVSLTPYVALLDQGMPAIINTVSEQIALYKDGANNFRALSMTCTHNGCAIAVANRTGLFCNCHGSEFTILGEVQKGPAEKPLTTYTVVHYLNHRVISIII